MKIFYEVMAGLIVVILLAIGFLNYLTVDKDQKDETIGQQSRIRLITLENGMVCAVAPRGLSCNWKEK